MLYPEDTIKDALFDIEVALNKIRRSSLDMIAGEYPCYKLTADGIDKVRDILRYVEAVEAAERTYIDLEGL
jgi:hypothetical protein